VIVNVAVFLFPLEKKVKPLSPKNKAPVKKPSQEEIQQRRVTNKARYWQRRLSRETLLFPYAASVVTVPSSLYIINL